MLSRTHIRQFLAVVDTGSFSRAANSLNVTQPSLSGGIAELERQLGTKLFVRERKRIRLTQAGNILLPLARSIEENFHKVEGEISSLPVPARPIRFGVIESTPSAWLEKIVATYVCTAPLELTEGGERELRSALANGSIDLALTVVGREPAPQSEVLLREPYCLALSARHPLAFASHVTASDVAGETMLARRSCEALAETSRFFTERGVRPRFALRSGNDDRIMAMVRAGLGVTVAPQSLGTDGISMVPIAGFNLVRNIGLCFGSHWHSKFGPDHELIRVLRETVRRAL